MWTNKWNISQGNIYPLYEIKNENFSSFCNLKLLQQFCCSTGKTWICWRESRRGPQEWSEHFLSKFQWMTPAGCNLMSQIYVLPFCKIHLFTAMWSETHLFQKHQGKDLTHAVCADAWQRRNQLKDLRENARCSGLWPFHLHCICCRISHAIHFPLVSPWNFLKIQSFPGRKKIFNNYSVLPLEFISSFLLGNLLVPRITVQHCRRIYPQLRKRLWSQFT